MELNNNGEKVSIHERIRCLEVKVDLILNNHLPHLEQSIKELSAKFWAIVILLIGNLVAALVGFLKG